MRTTSLLPALEEKYPGCHISWVTESSAEPLLIKNPSIDRILSPPERFLPFLMAGGFDLVINTDADLQSCSLASIAKAAEKRGFVLDENGEIEALSDAALEWYQLGLWDDLKRANRHSYPEIIYKIAGLGGFLHPPKLFLADDEIADAKKYLASCGWHSDDDRRVVGVNTGAGQRWRRKALPVETIEAVLANLLEGSLPVDIFLLGGPEERGRNSYLAEKFRGGVIDTGTNNSLRRFAGIVSATHVLLTADTLAMHIGMALQKYVVAHFGPTSPWEIEMWGSGEKIVPDIDCTCCYLPDCDRNPACNEAITPEEIVSAIQRGLKQTAQNSL
ncbi:MAG: glycosyltransferase family 9 protein [Candidatus Glassbacteria bacterium]